MQRVLGGRMGLLGLNGGILRLGMGGTDSSIHE